MKQWEEEKNVIDNGEKKLEFLKTSYDVKFQETSSTKIVYTPLPTPFPWAVTNFSCRRMRTEQELRMMSLNWGPGVQEWLKTKGRAEESNLNYLRSANARVTCATSQWKTYRVSIQFSMVLPVYREQSHMFIWRLDLSILESWANQLGGS